MGSPQQISAFSLETNNSSVVNLAPSDRVNEACDSGRERLKKHREEVAGQVVITDTWGHEDFLKDWIDCSSFDKLLAPDGIASARQSLAAEGQKKSTSQRLRIGSRC
ncbi:hypothetical protein P3X46_000046 [Hevea brasiliensis]|uniref:Uncharacterized protein n=1 Tax=Hevea brasiliensis TaxID=3981 RepID=A0ABQ9NA63_HEVBR|nr:hypothetical protein P3X46_000046 [Hevea brasiliensis]